MDLKRHIKPLYKEEEVIKSVIIRVTRAVYVYTITPSKCEGYNEVM